MGVWIEIFRHTIILELNEVAPFVGVWIEIPMLPSVLSGYTVAPFVGVWIEIEPAFRCRNNKRSLPSWECGLKFNYLLHFCDLKIVAPFVGVWIEIELLQDCYPWMQVAPFVGVWIEIIFRLFSSALMLCRSLRGSVD